MLNNLLLFARLLILGALLAGCPDPGNNHHPPPPKPARPQTHVGAWTGDFVAVKTGLYFISIPAAWAFHPDGTFKRYRFDFSVPLPNNDRFGGGGPLPEARSGVNGQWVPIGNGTYSIDYSRNPVVLTLTARNDQGQMQSAAGPLRFADANTMYIALGKQVTALDEMHGAQRWTRADIRQFPRQ